MLLRNSFQNNQATTDGSASAKACRLKDLACGVNRSMAAGTSCEAHEADLMASEKRLRWVYEPDDIDLRCDEFHTSI